MSSIKAQWDAYVTSLELVNEQDQFEPFVLTWWRIVEVVTKVTGIHITCTMGQHVKINGFDLRISTTTCRVPTTIQCIGIWLLLIPSDLSFALTL